MSNIRFFTDENLIEPQARNQVYNISKLPILAGPVAVMPDCHFGKGATVGSVIPTKGAIIPAAVGVDLSCGMVALPINLTASDLPSNLSILRTMIEMAIPVGFSKEVSGVAPSKELVKDFKALSLSVNLNEEKVWNQLASLGGGNHFIEVCIDENQDVWLMLHSGSRNAGKVIAEYYISKAKKQASERHDVLPDQDLAWLDDNTDDFKEYAFALEWAGRYASENRAGMMKVFLKAVSDFIGKPLLSMKNRNRIINVHHNYIVKEGDIWITRKGAISAKEGEFGIIPGSMGSKSYIVKGKGNPESYSSCSHGAGRRMSRGEARRTFTQDDLKNQTEGVECRKDIGIVDEIPGSYKDIDVVMKESESLVDIVHTLKAVLCVKG